MASKVIEEINNLIALDKAQKQEKRDIEDTRLTEEFVKGQIEKYKKEKDWSKKSVSYSNYSLYSRCPLSWYHTYVTKEIKYTPSIHTVFGTAFHEMFQEYFETMTSTSVKAADELDVSKMLQENIKKEYANSMKGRTEHFSTGAELGEFWRDGVDIMKWFKSRRRTYFNAKDTVLLGIELPIFMPIFGDVHLTGFLDLVLFDKRTRRIKIVDIKTSGRGWSKWVKKDKMKQAQLILYKIYFSEQYKIPIENIDVEFFIVKRKLLEDSEFPQKRIQVFQPSSGKVNCGRVQRDFNSYLEKCYNKDGTFKDQEYPATEGERQKSCTFCALKDNEQLCPKSKRIKS